MTIRRSYQGSDLAYGYVLHLRANGAQSKKWHKPSWCKSLQFPRPMRHACGRPRALPPSRMEATFRISHPVSTAGCPNRVTVQESSQPAGWPLFLLGLVTTIRVPPHLETDIGLRIGTAIRPARRTRCERLGSSSAS
jgi:hypothetical protein